MWLLCILSRINLNITLDDTIYDKCEGYTKLFLRFIQHNAR